MFFAYHYRKYFTRPAALASLSGFLCTFVALLVAVGCGGGSDDSSPEPSRPARIVFVSSDQGFEGINTINPDGTGRKLVFPTDSHTTLATFSPDGTKIAFLSPREDCGGVGCSNSGIIDYPTQIWLINADGTGLRQMTRREHGYGNTGSLTMAFSRDGSRILYNTYEPSENGFVNVLRAVPIDSVGDDTVLVRGTESEFMFEREMVYDTMSLSPDGSKVLFSEGGHGRREIYMKNLDGSNQTRLTKNSMNDFSPLFSPDGTKILFLRNGVSGPNFISEIYVMNADGTGEKRLTSNLEYEAVPSFSPDGTKIAFVGDGNSSPNAAVYLLFVMNADGSDPHPIPADNIFGGLSGSSQTFSANGAWGLVPIE